MPLSQLSERYHVHINLLYKWKKRDDHYNGRIPQYHVELTIQRAMEKRPRIIYNDSQFSSGDFRKFLRKVGLVHVRTLAKYLPGNGKIERFHRTLKEECLSRKSLIDLADARQQIADLPYQKTTQRLPVCR